ncbi:MAG: M48 family metallopeptidase [Candidatus Eisenbacteria bacterium]|nr:M48 family metallopeptidase [Candidatus Eisenbacteria bacterium]
MEFSLLTSAVRLGPRQGRSLHAKFVAAAEALDLDVLPELYIESGPVNAYAFGTSRFRVVLGSQLLDLMTEEEVVAVIGHELGHVKCEHMLLTSIARLLARGALKGIASAFPLVGSAALIGLVAALQKWSRVAEVSCDRAAMIVVRDEQVVARALGKLGGWSKAVAEEIDLDSMVVQSKEYEHLADGLDTGLFQLMYMAETWDMSHPFVVDRVRQIVTWGRSDQYRALEEARLERQVEA